MQPSKCLLFLTTIVYSARCFKILAVFPYTASSHAFTYKPLLEKLRENGHNIKLGAFFSLNQKNPLDVKFNITPSADIRLGMDQIKGTRFEKLYLPHYLHTVPFNKVCDELLSSKEFKDLLQSNETYDIILTEHFTTSCHITPLIQKHQVPFIAIQTNALMAWAAPWLDVPYNPSYIPVLFWTFPTRMNFLERLENFLIWIYVYMHYYLAMTAQDDTFLKKFDHCEGVTSHEIMQNASLVLTCSHFSYGIPRPLPPRTVEVGGMHIGKCQPLPRHLEKWINESEHGVIYFSLGSMIKGHTFPEEKKQMFINAFNRLPQRVLWKWENETMSGKTDNIMIEKWMPQFDILCHPNVKVFIAHGGMLGVTEAVHCGVPMVIMPQFGDQFTNAKAVEANGGGVILDYRYLDEESIYNSLTTALDPKFNKKAKELSARFKDRPLPPLETAIYWIEYVARHGGAPHLKTAAVGMPLYQYLLLDVIAFLAVIFFSVIFIVYYISRAILRKLCGCRQSAQKLKKN